MLSDDTMSLKATVKNFFKMFISDDTIKQEGYDGPVSLHWLIDKTPAEKTL